MNPSICVTIDYELYGDGSGSIEQHMLRPADEVLSFFSEHKIRATFFIEVLELIAMEKAVRSGKGPRSLATDIGAVRHQLSRIVAEGHDIQLHLHPQWHGARWSEEGWILKSDHYSLLQWGERVLKDLVSEGRHYLEELARPVRPDYECRIFRAGGFHFDRSERLGQILYEEGIRIDSSACRGYWRQTPYSSIDYRDLIGHSRPYWRTLDGGIGAVDRPALWEIPIWATYARQWRKIAARRLRPLLARNRFRGGLEQGISQTGLSSNPVKLLRWMWQTQPMIWDFCLLSGTQLMKSFQTALDFHQPEGFFPLVMMGHTKHFRDMTALEEFHAGLDRRQGVEWLTMSAGSNRIASQ